MADSAAMILIDKLTESNEQFRELMFNSRVLRFHRDVYDMAMDLVENDKGQIERIAPFVCWPDNDTWIEVDTGDWKRFGFLFQASRDGNTTGGIGMLVIEDRKDEEPLVLTCAYDLPSYRMTPFSPREELASRLFANPSLTKQVPAWLVDRLGKGDPILEAASVAPLMAAFKPILFSLLALINSPKLVSLRSVDQSKINRARKKRGKPLFHPHHVIRLNVDSTRINVTRGDGTGPKREQHFVRAHPRFFVHRRYKNVSVVMIPPHYRGDPKLGTRYTEYKADRSQSKWKD
jgi:hypothetical protein